MSKNIRQYLTSPGKLAFSVAGVLTFSAVALAEDVSLPSDNPFAAIVTRNAFGLSADKRVVVEPNPPAAPTGRIVVNGIMTLLGRVQVLFTVTSEASAGKLQVTVPCILGEGERRDDIVVEEIDFKNRTVTFNNCGILQQIPMAGPSHPDAPLPK